MKKYKYNKGVCNSVLKYSDVMQKVRITFTQMNVKL